MANTIDEVITDLTNIIELADSEASRIGYFAALYRRVTIRVKEQIAGGFFLNAAQMERLDVEFANRYLEAYGQFRNGQPTTASWAAAFNATRSWRPLIIQHLLLGMNAHINLDLGIAAQKTCPGELLPSLKPDFDAINQILAEMVQPVETQLAGVSPWIGLLNKVNAKADEVILNFSMKIARGAAWKFALELNEAGHGDRTAVITRKDEEIAQLAATVASPHGIVLNAGLLAIRLRETSDVRRVIAALR